MSHTKPVSCVLSLQDAQKAKILNEVCRLHPSQEKVLFEMGAFARACIKTGQSAGMVINAPPRSGTTRLAKTFQAMTRLGLIADQTPMVSTYLSVAKVSTSEDLLDRGLGQYGVTTDGKMVSEKYNAYVQQLQSHYTDLIIFDHIDKVLSYPGKPYWLFDAMEQIVRKADLSAIFIVNDWFEHLQVASMFLHRFIRQWHLIRPYHWSIPSCSKEPKEQRVRS